MEDNALKHVEFDRYCETCIHWGTDQGEDPCDECLSHPVRLYSHKPERYQKDEKKK